MIPAPQQGLSRAREHLAPEVAARGCVASSVDRSVESSPALQVSPPSVLVGHRRSAHRRSAHRRSAHRMEERYRGPSGAGEHGGPTSGVGRRAVVHTMAAPRRPTAPPPTAPPSSAVTLHGYAEELGERVAEAAKVVLEKPLLGEHALGDDAHEGKGTVRLAKVDGSPIR